MDELGDLSLPIDCRWEIKCQLLEELSQQLTNFEEKVTSCLVYLTGRPRAFIGNYLPK